MTEPSFFIEMRCDEYAPSRLGVMVRVVAFASQATVSPAGHITGVQLEVIAVMLPVKSPPIPRTVPSGPPADRP